jgi:hypothetical protein
MGHNLTVTRTRSLRSAILGLALAGAAGGCNSSNVSALPADVKSIMFLQRTPRNTDGNVFDYTNFVAGARLVTLSPPSADGKLTVLTSDPMFQGADIMSYDLSFDATAVVFSAHLAADSNYHLFSMNLDGTNIQQLTEGGNDYVYPVFVPGGQIMFMTNRNVEADADPSSAQFKDEYERATTAQVGIINADGTNLTLGPRNVSHRVSPALLPDGHVLYTEWMHMGPVNEGHLRMVNTDMTGMREAFGDELGASYPSTNSYLKARYVQTKTFNDPAAGPINDYQVIAIGTSRDRTLQSGKLMLIDLNGSEANSTSQDLTPSVPGDRTPSPLGIGRYYDAEPVGSSAPGQFLASWSDGPVESEELDRAMSTAQFGIYVFDANSGTRFPVYDDPAYWDILARPIRSRPEPTNLASPISGTSTTVGSLNVYNSSLMTIPAGSIVKVRLLEGFSGEEGGVDMFGSTDFDGQSRYGEVPLQADNSFAAVVPANVPFHMQLIDKFAMATAVSGGHGTASSASVANEDIWISGRAGEQRFCGGCHENRTAPSSITPGVQDNVLRGAVNLDVPRVDRVSKTAYQLGTTGALPPGPIAGDNGVRGVPWDLAIQPILDAKCVSCHDGTAGPANPQYTVTDMTSGTSQNFIFDLRGQKLDVTVGERMTGDFTASYISLLGLGEILGDDVTSTTTPAGEDPLQQLFGTGSNYVAAASAETSPLMYLLNPPQRFPAVDTTVRAFGTTAFTKALGTTNVTFSGMQHPAEVGGTELTPDEYYLLILNIDMGGQYFFRENLDEAGAATN